MDTDKVTIGPNSQQAPYAGYVEFGTKPHEIRPKKPGGVLVFNVNGMKVVDPEGASPGHQGAAVRSSPHSRHGWTRLGTMAAEANVKVFTDNAT